MYKHHFKDCEFIRISKSILLFSITFSRSSKYGSCHTNILFKKLMVENLTCTCYDLGMAILPRPAWPAPPRFAPCGFSPPRKGGGAGMGQDFRPAPRGGAGMGLHFLDPPRPIPTPSRPIPAPWYCLVKHLDNII